MSTEKQSLLTVKIN